MPVALNANELIQNSNDFVKYKLPLNDKNKYFYLSSTSISYRYDCPRDEKEPCYKLIFTPLDNSYEDNITLYIDVESKKLIDSKVEINNDYNYRISLKKNKGYFYQVNIKNYNVVCDDILTNPEE